ncbi:tail needle protein [Streptomyces phage phiScoe1]|nr:tail needle protein [Streptomyces phage phiScoe1]
MEPSVQVALVTAGSTVTVALVGVVVELLRRQANAINEVREHALEARDQVANTHSTNLRDDLDAVAHRIDRVLALQEQHGTDIAALRSDIAHERRERLAVAERLDDHMAANAA